MRSLVIAALFLALSATAGRAAGFDAAQKAELDKLSQALNSIKTMKGAFVQIDPNGSLENGKFWIEKPGRVRFAYASPSDTLIVSNGVTVAVKNTKLDTVDRYPLVSTPLDLVLSNKLDLANNPNIIAVNREGSSLIVKARSTDKKVSGTVTLVFSDPGYELRQWTVLDPQGLKTTIALQNVEIAVQLKPSLFVLEERNRFTKGQSD
ncbi:MAG: LolA family protein [Rhizomicrobium sp.]